MKRKFKRDSDLAAQLGRAFTKFERAIIKANCEFIKDLRSIERTHGAIFALDADKLADAYQTFIQAYYTGTLIAQGAA
ncbi:MAG: hypothetical protein IJ667_07225 [Synergistaceae bacterium]|nr:hypothetical protein [Synergistaceae bacterium]